MSITPDTRQVIQWGWAGRALEAESGDLHVVVPFAGGALVALLDGLGHGAEAAAAACAAASILEAHAGEPVLKLLEQCHEGTRKSRGAVMSVASFRVDESSLTWAGVGNVAALLVRTGGSSAHATEAIVTPGGVIGYRLPSLHSNTLRVRSGDTLIMTTDGIRFPFIDQLDMTDAPQEIAESVLAGFATGSDDAHVVVARYLGGSA